MIVHVGIGALAMYVWLRETDQITGVHTASDPLLGGVAVAALALAASWFTAWVLRERQSEVVTARYGRLAAAIARVAPNSYVDESGEIRVLNTVLPYPGPPDTAPPHKS